VTTSTGRFTATGSLQKARGLHTAALLGNGKVLVAGGANRADPLCIGGISSAELYDPATSSFAPTGALGQPRYSHTATVLQNGQVLVVGGFGSGVDCEDVGIDAQNSAELYNPDIGSFAKTGSMDTPRGGHTATLLPNGTVLIAGGEDQVGGKGSANVELYDPRTGVFTRTGSMTVARYLHTATLLTNGKVIIVGGAPGDTANPTSAAEVYNPATGSFAPTGSMATAREEHTATLLSDGKVLIIGGQTPGSSGLQTTVTGELYDPSTGLFAAAGSMAEARAAHTATMLPSGNVLIAGGGDDNSTAELYDPTTNAFSITGGMEIGHSGHSETLLPNGAVLVAGGGSRTPISSAEVYSEDGNPWDY
jgi:Galactose oxidase, central domain